MTQIVTLTINPALDVSTSVKKMMPFTKMRCAPAHRDPGGGGINVARVLKRLGIDATAIYPAGGATGQLLATLVEREGVRSIVIPTSNDTREDITIFDETTREQFRLVFPGAPLSDVEWQECLESMARITPAACVCHCERQLAGRRAARFFRQGGSGLESAQQGDRGYVRPLPEGRPGSRRLSHQAQPSASFRNWRELPPPTKPR